MSGLRSCITHGLTHTSAAGVTRDHHGHLRGVRQVSEPGNSRHSTHFSFSVTGRDKGIILALRGKTINCTSGVLTSPVGLSVHGRRTVTVIKPGKVNGSALLGSVVSRVSLLGNEIRLNTGISLNCCSRRLNGLSGGGDILTRV